MRSWKRMTCKMKNLNIYRLLSSTGDSTVGTKLMQPSLCGSHVQLPSSDAQAFRSAPAPVIDAGGRAQGRGCPPAVPPRRGGSLGRWWLSSGRGSSCWRTKPWPARWWGPTEERGTAGSQCLGRHSAQRPSSADPSDNWWSSGLRGGTTSETSCHALLQLGTTHLRARGKEGHYTGTCEKRYLTSCVLATVKDAGSLALCQLLAWQPGTRQSAKATKNLCNVACHKMLKGC